MSKRLLSGLFVFLMGWNLNVAVANEEFDADFDAVEVDQSFDTQMSYRDHDRDRDRDGGRWGWDFISCVRNDWECRGKARLHRYDDYRTDRDFRRCGGRGRGRDDLACYGKRNRRH